MTKWIQDSNDDYICSLCGSKSKEPTKYCPHCGAVKTEVEVTLKNCKNCDYMKELGVNYDDCIILYPYCYGQKNSPRVKYTDCCSDFKEKGEIKCTDI